MEEEEFATLLARGYESSGVEFKGVGRRSDKNLFGQVTRAVLGMANRRDGGYVIIGVTDDGGALEPRGLEEEYLETWKNFDELSEAINGYASPSVAFDLEVRDDQGNQYAVLVVHEFDDIPILCRHGYNVKSGKKDTQILRKGACYVRSRHKPETSEIPSEEEMRELLELAIDKGVRKFVERARRAGFVLPSQPPVTQTRDEEKAREQVEDLQ